MPTDTVRDFAEELEAARDFLVTDDGGQRSEAGIARLLMDRYPWLGREDRRALARQALEEAAQEAEERRKRVRWGLVARKARQRRNRDVEEVAEAAGVAPYLVRRAENGDPIPDADRRAIGRAVTEPTDRLAA